MKEVVLNNVLPEPGLLSDYEPLIPLSDMRNGGKSMQTLTGLSSQTLRNLVRRGELPALKIGGRWYIKRTDMETYIENGGCA